MRSKGIPYRIDEIINEVEDEFHQLWSGSERWLEPLSEISVINNDIIITVDLPCIENKEYITLNLNEHSLEIKAEFIKPIKWERWGTIQKEIGFITYKKTINIPEKINPMKAKAKFNRGILTITIPSVSKKSNIKID